MGRFLPVGEAPACCALRKEATRKTSKRRDRFIASLSLSTSLFFFPCFRRQRRRITLFKWPLKPPTATTPSRIEARER